jgi:hypothetical protein
MAEKLLGKKISPLLDESVLQAKYHASTSSNPFDEEISLISARSAPLEPVRPRYQANRGNSIAFISWVHGFSL